MVDLRIPLHLSSLQSTRRDRGAKQGVSRSVASPLMKSLWQLRTSAGLVMVDLRITCTFQVYSLLSETGEQSRASGCSGVGASLTECVPQWRRCESHHTQFENSSTCLVR
jgi:hypothetical protein